MTKNNAVGLHLADLKDYIEFLLKNHLEEATINAIRLAREYEIPLLQAFAHLTEEELLAYSLKDLKAFFESIVAGSVMEITYANMQKWASNELEGIEGKKIVVADAVLANSIRKQMLLGLLPRFTQDTQKAVAVAIAIEKLYARLEEMTLATYVGIREEDLKEINTNLKEYQEELQAANEELRESHDDLYALNQQLEQEAKKRKTAELALEREHNFLRAILEHIQDGIVACDEHGMLSFFNKATRDFHGIREQALPPEQWSAYYSLYQSDGKTPLRKEEIPLFRAYQGEVVEHVDMVIAPAVGKARHVVANGQQILSKEGKMMGAVAIMHDVTLQKTVQEKQRQANELLHEKNQELAAALEELQSAEEQLLEANAELELRVKARTEELASSEEELRQTLDHTVELNQRIIESRNLLHTVANAAPVTLWMSDDGGNITYVNQTWIDWTGRPFDDHLGEGWALSIIPEDRARVGERFLADLQARRLYHVDFRINHSDGQQHWCVVEGVPRYLSDGTFTGYVGSCLDITERKHAEDALKLKNEQLEKINNDLDNFVYTASHDLKAPISNIEGLMQTLMRYMPSQDMENPVIGKVITMINASVERFKKTIFDLTELTKLQRDTEDDVTQVYFSDMLNEVLLDMETLIQDADASFHINLAACPSVRFSEKNMRSIIYNLVSNAVKYRSPDRKPVICVKSESEGGYCSLTVKDNGLGMDLSQESKIFTMFKRLHDHVEGSGIGLYIVKKIVENSGGHIKVTSEPGKGSIFKVYIKQS